MGGGALLVHSSLKSLGPLAGGPEAVVSALLTALGSDGTLLMPALSYLTVTAAAPRFDVRSTPSNVGAIPEYFRTRGGTARSVHPTHSVCALGPAAAALLGGHLDDDTPCGPHSPFRRLPGLGGQILMIGCGLRANTSMHGIEELAVPAPPYLFGPMVSFEIVLENRARVRKEYRCHSFVGWTQRYDRVARLLDARSLRRGRLLEAEAFLIDARALREAALEALHRDPFYFVDRI